MAVRVLRSAIASGRIAPAYLLVGPHGVGKRFTAVQFIKALNCTVRHADACDECSSCRLIDRGEFPDYYVPQKGARKIGKGGDGETPDLTEVMRRLHFAPVMGKYKVVLIDPGEALSAEAANMLLKTLEEPPSRTVFVLTAVVQAAILPTIQSRCQSVRFPPLPVEVVARYLSARGTDAALAESVARAGRGSIEVAEELLEAKVMDQKMVVVDYLFSLFESPLATRVDDSLRLLGSLAGTERESLSMIASILSMFARDLLWALHEADAENLVFSDRARDLSRLAAKLSQRRVLGVAALGHELAAGMGRNENPKHLLFFLGNKIAELAAASSPAQPRSIHARS